MISEEERKSQFMPNMDYNVIALRLSTVELLEELKDILKGQAPVIKTDPNTGVQSIEKVKVTEPLVNDHGFRMLYSLARSCINNAVVQGNNRRQDFEFQVYDFETNLAVLLACNSQEWGIDPQDREIIQISFVTLFANFLSRTIDNKERESYGLLKEGSSRNTVQNRGLFGGMQ